MGFTIWVLVSEPGDDYKSVAECEAAVRANEFENWAVEPGEEYAFVDDNTGAVMDTFTVPTDYIPPNAELADDEGDDLPKAKDDAEPAPPGA